MLPLWSFSCKIWSVIIFSFSPFLFSEHISALISHCSRIGLFRKTLICIVSLGWKKLYFISGPSNFLRPILWPSMAISRLGSPSFLPFFDNLSASLLNFLFLYSIRTDFQVCFPNLVLTLSNLLIKSQFLISLPSKFLPAFFLQFWIL